MAIVSRGRRSAAQLAIVGSSGIETNPRPKPPADFTPDEKAEWKRQVDAVPDDYFPPETHGVLAQYCRHIVRARWIAKQLSDMQADQTKFDARKYAALLSAEAQQTAAIKTLATSMRLTQKSVEGVHSRRRANLAKPVWSRQEA